MQVELKTRGGDLVDRVEAPMGSPRVLTLGLRMFLRATDRLYVECDWAEAVPTYPIEHAIAS